MTEGAALLELDRLSVTFGQQRAVDNVSLRIRPGAVHGLVGSNGSGKSTVVKVLAGYHFPDPTPRADCRVLGEVVDLYAPTTVAPRPDLAFVHQDLALVDSMSVLDNLRLSGRARGLGGLSRVRWKAEGTAARQLLAGVGLGYLDPGRPVRALTQSERVLVAVARALERRRDLALLVLDEATANVDSRDVGTIHQVVREVAARQGAVLYISHRIDEILAICTDVSVLRDGQVVFEESVRRLDKSTLVREMVGPRGGDLVESPTAREAAGPTRTEAPGLELADLAGGRCRGISLRAGRGDIVGVIGLAGSGAEELAPLVFGARRRTGGAVMVRGEPVEPIPGASIAAGMAYIPADRRGAASFQSLTARENASIGVLEEFRRGPWLSRRAEGRSVARQLVDAHVEPPYPSMIMRKFSGGNQQKLILSRWLRRDLTVLVLEQPTQGVDIETRARLYARFHALADAGCAILVVSSDEDELTVLCDRVHVVVDGRVSEVIERDRLTTQELVRACHVSTTGSIPTADTGGSNVHAH